MQTKRFPRKHARVRETRDLTRRKVLKIRTAPHDIRAEQEFLDALHKHRKNEQVPANQLLAPGWGF